MEQRLQKKLLRITLACLCGALVFSGCAQSAEEAETGASPEEVQEVVEEAADDGSLWLEFDAHDSATMEKASGWSNGQMFNCTWRGDNVTFDGGKMQLRIDDDYAGLVPPYSGGEYRSREFYHYGMYEVSMKPIKGDGVVSSMFTYTGPSDNNPWDEIDIEFLGKDTTVVQFNYFTNGIGQHEHVHKLGFDASEEFHVYGFLWLEDSITWYVDGEEVHKAEENIPSTPSKIMMNVWPGIGVDGWLKPFSGDVPLTAEYEWLRFTPEENL